jgi:hypothetical protein
MKIFIKFTPTEDVANRSKAGSATTLLVGT